MSGLNAVARARSVPVVMSLTSLGRLVSAMFHSSTVPVSRAGCKPQPPNASIVASELMVRPSGLKATDQTVPMPTAIGCPSGLGRV